MEGVLAITSFVVFRGEIEVERRAESPDGSVTDRRKESWSSDSSKKSLTVLKMLFPGTQGRVFLCRLLITVDVFQFWGRGICDHGLFTHFP